MAHLREAFISHVLMNTALPDVRFRFEKMMGIRDEDGELIEDDDDEDEQGMFSGLSRSTDDELPYKDEDEAVY
jgi:hypothetical protein